MDIRTAHVRTSHSTAIFQYLLVRRSVFDNAANMVMSTGPKRGWKLSACAKLRYVFPNQICTINQAMLFKDHLPESAAAITKGVSYSVSSC